MRKSVIFRGLSLVCCRCRWCTDRWTSRQVLALVSRWQGSPSPSISVTWRVRMCCSSSTTSSGSLRPVQRYVRQSCKSLVGGMRVVRISKRINNLLQTRPFIVLVRWQVSALLGRIPSAVGYQPTLATDMGTMQERITTTKKGSITSVQAIYVPADDLTDPAPATTFAHLDATTVLSRGIAELGRWSLCQISRGSHIQWSASCRFLGKQVLHGEMRPLGIGLWHRDSSLQYWCVWRVFFAMTLNEPKVLVLSWKCRSPTPTETKMYRFCSLVLRQVSIRLWIPSTLHLVFSTRTSWDRSTTTWLEVFRKYCRFVMTQQKLVEICIKSIVVQIFTMMVTNPARFEHCYTMCWWERVPTQTAEWTFMPFGKA